MGTTPTYKLPYPELVDPADANVAVKPLADRLEVVLPTLAPPPPGATVGLLSARPPANTVPAGSAFYATDTLGGWVAAANAWVLVSQGAPLVSGLPASPYEGQEIVLVDLPSAPTIVRHLRWVSGAWVDLLLPRIADRQMNLDWIPVSDAGLKTVWSKLIPAGVMKLGTQIAFDAIGSMHSYYNGTSHPNPLTVNVLIDGTIVPGIAIWPTFDGSNSTVSAWRLNWWLQYAGSSSARLNGRTNASGYGSNADKQFDAAVAWNPAVDHTLAVQAQFGGAANAGNVWHMDQMTLEVR